MAWQTLCTEVEFLTQYPMVGLSIADSRSPIPGYLYGEVNAITYIDYGKNCKPLVDFFTSRLQAKTPLVSQKILKMLMYLVKNGHHEILQEMKINEVSLKTATSFYGPEDDLYGKTVYENIRTLAKELLDYIFSENTQFNEANPVPCKSDLPGYGSDANFRKMAGFGHSAKIQKSVSTKVGIGISNFVEKLISSSADAKSDQEVIHIGEDLPQYKPLIINKSDSSDVCMAQSKATTSPAKARTPQRPKQRPFKPGRPGGGWDECDDLDQSDEEVEDIASSVAKSKASSVSFDPVEFSEFELKEDTSLEWEDERKIVYDFTKNEPLQTLDTDSISASCKSCSCVNCDKILSFLVERLQEKEENIKLRTLIFIEYLLFYDVVALDSVVRIVLPSLHSYETEESVAPSVKVKAKKVTLIIGNMNKFCKKHSREQS